MESSRQEMQLIGSDCPKRKINALLNECRKVLEIVFSSLAVAYPLVGIWKRVYVPRIDRFSGRQKMEPQKDQRMVAATYEGAFRSLGFSEPFPDSLLSVKPGQIRSVSEFHNYWQMRPVLTATAMLAQRDPIHPLAEAAKICPELLTTIDEVVCAGGSASHADGDTVSPDEAEQIVEKVYDIVSVMMGLTSAESDSLNKSIKSHG